MVQQQCEQQQQQQQQVPRVTGLHRVRGTHKTCPGAQKYYHTIIDAVRTFFFSRSSESRGESPTALVWLYT